MDEAALEFYYFGFHAALRRFRSLAGVGWLVAGAGAGAFLVRWQLVQFPGWYDLVVCLGCVASGIGLVQAAVGALAAYVRIPFPLPASPSGEQEEIVGRLRDLMRNVEEGGWREARETIHRLRELGDHYGLPSPLRPPRLQR